MSKRSFSSKMERKISDEEVSYVIRMLKLGLRASYIARLVGYDEKLIRLIAQGKHSKNRKPVGVRLGKTGGKQPMKFSKAALKQLTRDLLTCIIQGRRLVSVVKRKMHIAPKEWGCAYRVLNGTGTSKGLQASWYNARKVFLWLETKLDLPFTIEEFDDLIAQSKAVDKMMGSVDSDYIKNYYDVSHLDSKLDML